MSKAVSAAPPMSSSPPFPCSWKRCCSSHPCCCWYWGCGCCTALAHELNLLASTGNGIMLLQGDGAACSRAPQESDTLSRHTVGDWLVAPVGSDGLVTSDCEDRLMI